MRNTIKTAVVHGFTGRGPSAKEAKDHAIAKIESLQEGYWTPRMVHWRGMVGVCYRDLEGWSYFIIRPGDEREHPCTLHIGQSQKDAVNALRRHMAQNGWTLADGCNLPAVLCANPVQDRTEFISWMRWQVAYQEGREQGMDDHAARMHAAAV